MEKVNQYLGKTVKLDYIDYFRAIAIIFIVLGHSVCFGRSTMVETNNLLFRGGTYFFVFIAGFLFWHLSYKFEIKTYYKKKLLNIICPYFITLLPAACIAVFFNQKPTASIIMNGTDNVARFFAILLNGWSLNISLWFVGMIVLIFLISPLIIFLRRKNKVVYVAFFLMSLILCILISRYDAVIGAESLLNFMLKGLKIYYKNALHFLFFYLLGIEVYDFIKNNKEIVEKNLKNVFFISSFLYIFHFILHLYVVKGGGEIQTISKTIETFVLLFGLMIVESKIKANKFLDKALKFVAQYSFGIFFIHSYLRNLFWFHTIIPQKMAHIIVTNKNTLKCALTSWEIFFGIFFGSIILLVVLKTILNTIGIKNTRHFIGV